MEFSLTSSTSRTPRSASQRASASTSAGGRDTNDPRKDGIAQKAQRRSQPLAIFSGAQGRWSSLVRSTGATATDPCPGACAEDAARSTGAMGSRVRRSRGACVGTGVPWSTESRIAPSSG